MDRTKTILNNVRKSGYAFEYRITILGDKMTGKTSLLNRYLSSTFTHRYRPTIEEHVTHIVEHNGSICVCLFIDTCGGNDFPAMRRLEISKGNAFFVVYAINDRKTFDTCKKILDEIKTVKADAEDLKIILIGAKTDLEEEREIGYNEGRALLDELKERHVNSQFFEVGAKDDNNVDIVFTSLLDMYIPNEIILDGRNTLPRKSRRSRKKCENRKQKPSKFELTRIVPSFSDSDLNICPTEIDTSGDIDFRCNSVSPQPTSRFQKSIRKDTNAKHFIQKTFGNMQKILGSGNTPGLFRSNTYDSSLSHSRKHVS